MTLIGNAVTLDPLRHDHHDGLVAAASDGAAAVHRGGVSHPLDESAVPYGVARLGAKQDGVLRSHKVLPDGALRDTVVFDHRAGVARGAQRAATRVGGPSLRVGGGNNVRSSQLDGVRRPTVLEVGVNIASSRTVTYKEPMSSGTGAPAEVAPSMARTSTLRELPSTARGMRTRSSLITAARKVFERAGYLDARLIDITAAAKCSAGTFYTYFSSKEEIFAAVLELAQEDMRHPGMPHVQADDDPTAIVKASNRAYFAAYKRNAKLMGLLDQVSSVDPEFRRLRQRRAEAFIRRNARGIEDLQRRGLADPTLNPLLASRALSGMISWLGFGYFVAKDGRDDAEPMSVEDLVDTATRLWVNALRITASA